MAEVGIRPDSICIKDCRDPQCMVGTIEARNRPEGLELGTGHRKPHTGSEME